MPAHGQGTSDCSLNAVPSALLNAHVKETDANQPLLNGGAHGPGDALRAFLPACFTFAVAVATLQRRAHSQRSADARFHA